MLNIVRNNSITKLSKPKTQKKSKMLEFQEKMSSKIRNEYNIKKKGKENLVISKIETYEVKMPMSKYKNSPKFMQNLNCTLSPRNLEKGLLTWKSAIPKLVPSRTKAKQR